ncbi:UNKNOWN [Stylonychia lemnae]|uniref:Peptidase C14 caspase domain-containing protein n=1 Tax=Stylonychia lemnae TaxID=5949 RepID=A0A078B1I7_STYLE|nr:UNKNOWN [Stylonychia lemnae]|eukprot:CDW87113.1 UNKNOWN [Stylonychia lemnae]
MDSHYARAPNHEMQLISLLVGCTNYPDYESAKPAIDLRRVKNYLKTIQFESTEIINPTIIDFKAELTKIQQTMPTVSHSVLFIYFSGKAKIINDKTCLILMNRDGQELELDVIDHLKSEGYNQNYEIVFLKDIDVPGHQQENHLHEHNLNRAINVSIVQKLKSIEMISSSQDFKDQDLFGWGIKTSTNQKQALPSVLYAKISNVVCQEFMELVKDDKIANQFCRFDHSIQITDQRQDLKIQELVDFFNIENNYLFFEDNSMSDIMERCSIKNFYLVSNEEMAIIFDGQKFEKIFEYQTLSIDGEHLGDCTKTISRQFLKGGQYVTSILPVHNGKSLIFGTNTGYINTFEYIKSSSDLTYGNYAINKDVTENGVVSEVKDMIFYKDAIFLAIIANYVSIFRYDSNYQKCYSNIIYLKSIKFEFNLNKLKLSHTGHLIAIETFHYYILGENFDDIAFLQDPYMQNVPIKQGTHHQFDAGDYINHKDLKKQVYLTANENTIFCNTHNVDGNQYQIQIYSNNYHEVEFTDGPLFNRIKKDLMIIPTKRNDGTYLDFYELENPLFEFVIPTMQQNPNN